MHIRRHEASDAEVYRALRLRALNEYPDAFTSSFEEENQRPLSDTQERMSLTSNTQMWGAFIEDKLVGVAGLRRETRVKSSHKASLVAMYVLPECSGQGLGLALVNTLVQNAHASGVELITLTVTEGNRQAAALYARAGFTAFGTEPDAIRLHGVPVSKQHTFLQLTL